MSSVFLTESTLSLNALTLGFTHSGLIYYSTSSCYGSPLGFTRSRSTSSLFAKNFHLPRHHHLALASALFLGRLRLCVLSVELTSLLFALPATTQLLPPLLPPLLSPISHRLVTYHRLVMIIFRFSLPPSLSCPRPCLVRRFLKSSKAAPLILFLFLFLFWARGSSPSGRGM